jgi:hypothetical protein
MTLKRIPSRQLDLGSVQSFEPLPEEPAGNQITVREGWLKAGTSIILKLVQTTVGFNPITNPSNVRWDLVYLDAVGVVTVVAGTEVANTSPEFTGVPTPPNLSFPVAYVKITETGAVIVAVSDITDLRPKFHIMEDHTYANVYAITNTEDYNTGLGKLSAATEAAATFVGRSGPLDNSPTYSNNFAINNGDSVELACGKLSAAVETNAGDINTIAAAILNRLYRTGEIKFTMEASEPTGWLFLNGRTLGNPTSGADVASNEVEDLFNIVKTLPGNTGSENFATGDTVTMVDARQRVPIVKAASGGASALGGIGGVFDHTHTVSHSHTINNHTHNINITTSGPSGLRTVYDGVDQVAVPIHTHNVVGSTTGTSGNTSTAAPTSSSNNQAYFVTNCLIKI